MAAVDALFRAGKILHVGLGDLSAWRVASAAMLAQLHGWAPLSVLQLEDSFSERTAASICRSLGRTTSECWLADRRHPEVVDEDPALGARPTLPRSIDDTEGRHVISPHGIRRSSRGARAGRSLSRPRFTIL